MGLDPELLSPDLVYRPPAEWPENEECRGIEEYRRFFEKWLEPWADDFTAVTEVRDYGDALISRIEFSGHARGSGLEVSGRVFEVYRLRDGLVCRIEDYLDRAEALKAVVLGK